MRSELAKAKMIADSESEGSSDREQALATAQHELELLLRRARAAHGEFAAVIVSILCELGHVTRVRGDLDAAIRYYSAAHVAFQNRGGGEGDASDHEDAGGDANAESSDAGDSAASLFAVSSQVMQALPMLAEIRLQRGQLSEALMLYVLWRAWCTTSTCAHYILCMHYILSIISVLQRQTSDRLIACLRRCSVCHATHHRRFNDLLEIQERVIGSSSPGYGATLLSIGRAQVAHGNAARGRQILGDALGIYEEVYGEDSVRAVSIREEIKRAGGVPPPPRKSKSAARSSGTLSNGMDTVGSSRDEGEIANSISSSSRPKREVEHSVTEVPVSSHPDRHQSSPTSAQTQDSALSQRRRAKQTRRVLVDDDDDDDGGEGTPSSKFSIVDLKACVQLKPVTNWHLMRSWTCAYAGDAISAALNRERDRGRQRGGRRQVPINKSGANVDEGKQSHSKSPSGHGRARGSALRALGTSSISTHSPTRWSGSDAGHAAGSPAREVREAHADTGQASRLSAHMIMGQTGSMSEGCVWLVLVRRACVPGHGSVKMQFKVYRFRV